MSLRGAEGDEAIPDNVTPIPLVRGASFHSLPVKGDERGVSSNSPASPEKIKTGLRIKYGMTDYLLSSFPRRRVSRILSILRY